MLYELPLSDRNRTLTEPIISANYLRNRLLTKDSEEDNTSYFIWNYIWGDTSVSSIGKSGSKVYALITKSKGMDKLDIKVQKKGSLWDLSPVQCTASIFLKYRQYSCQKTYKMMKMKVFPSN